jgi:hypothetical protein
MDTTPAGLSADDFFAIQNLYARYNLCSDEGEVEGYADCFTEDGVLELQPLGFKVAGREELRAHKERDMKSRGGRYRRHWNGSLHLEAAGPGAVRGRCYLVAYNGERSELPAIGDVGVYDDKVVKCADGKWRFSRRLLVMDAGTWTRK